MALLQLQYIDSKAKSVLGEMKNNSTARKRYSIDMISNMVEKSIVKTVSLT